MQMYNAIFGFIFLQNFLAQSSIRFHFSANLFASSIIMIDDINI